VEPSRHLTARSRLWYAYDDPWQQLRERSSWIELGFCTPQIDAAGDGRDPSALIAYLEKQSGVLDTRPAPPRVRRARCAG
jgi:hypothetical protein